MGDEVNNSFTEGQKNAIYKEMLVPLKLKISQILLYDTETALEFLQEYNEIVKNADSLGNQIIERIVELEFKMQSYLSKEGKEKAFEERSKAVLQSIEDLRIESIQLNLGDFENKFTKLKTDYEECVENYSFEDRDRIEKEIYELQANLIMRQAAGGKTADDLQQTITEQDKVGLNMFVMEQINNLRQKDGLKDIATKVNNIVMTDKDAVLRPELWSWLNAAKRGIKRDEQLQMTRPTTSTAMTVAPRNKNNTLMDRISRLFSKEPKFPLQVSDLKKINIEWLSKYIPKSMLLELENDRISEENSQMDNKYVPDSKAVIYDMFYDETRTDKEPTLIRKVIREDSKWKVYEQQRREYPLFGENNAVITIQLGINDMYSPYNGCYMYTEYYISATSGSTNKMTLLPDNERELMASLRLAELLDKIFNTDFQQQALREAKDVYIDKVSKKTPVCSNLKKCWDNMIEEYEQTKLEFNAAEEAKRRQFYEKYQFNEQLRLKNYSDNAVDDERAKIKPQRKKVIRAKKRGTEQGGR